MRIVLIAALLIASSMTHPATNTEEDSEKDDEKSRKIIGSSVVTSVSVILNNEQKPHFTDAIGKPIPRPLVPAQVASPINLLNPDSYEFYTFNDYGQLIKRMMTMKEIQSIVASGEGEGAMLIHSSPLNTNDKNAVESQRNVQEIVTNVQNVLNKEIEMKKNQTVQNNKLDTPDTSSTWSIILPAIFGNTGDQIVPSKIGSSTATVSQQNQQQHQTMVHLKPDSVIISDDANVVRPTTTHVSLSSLQQTKVKPKPDNKNKITKPNINHIPVVESTPPTIVRITQKPIEISTPRGYSSTTPSPSSIQSYDNDVSTQQTGYRIRTTEPPSRFVTRRRVTVIKTPIKQSTTEMPSVNSVDQKITGDAVTTIMKPSIIEHQNELVTPIFTRTESHVVTSTITPTTASTNTNTEHLFDSNFSVNQIIQTLNDERVSSSSSSSSSTSVMTPISSAVTTIPQSTKELPSTIRTSTTEEIDVIVTTPKQPIIEQITPIASTTSKISTTSNVPTTTTIKNNRPVIDKDEDDKIKDFIKVITDNMQLNKINNKGSTTESSVLSTIVSSPKPNIAATTENDTELQLLNLIKTMTDNMSLMENQSNASTDDQVDLMENLMNTSKNDDDDIMKNQSNSSKIHEENMMDNQLKEKIDMINDHKNNLTMLIMLDTDRVTVKIPEENSEHRTTTTTTTSTTPKTMDELMNSTELPAETIYKPISISTDRILEKTTITPDVDDEDEMKLKTITEQQETIILEDQFPISNSKISNEIYDLIKGNLKDMPVPLHFESMNNNHYIDNEQEFIKIDNENNLMSNYLDQAATVASILHHTGENTKEDTIKNEELHQMFTNVMSEFENDKTNVSVNQMMGPWGILDTDNHIPMKNNSYETSIVSETSSVSVEQPASMEKPLSAVASNNVEATTKIETLHKESVDQGMALQELLKNIYETDMLMYRNQSENDQKISMENSSTEISIESDIHEEMHSIKMKKPINNTSTISTTIPTTSTMINNETLHKNIASGILDAIGLIDEDVIAQKFNLTYAENTGAEDETTDEEDTEEDILNLFDDTKDEDDIEETSTSMSSLTTSWTDNMSDKTESEINQFDYQTESDVTIHTTDKQLSIELTDNVIMDDQETSTTMSSTIEELTNLFDQTNNDAMINQIINENINTMLYGDKYDDDDDNNEDEDTDDMANNLTSTIASDMQLTENTATITDAEENIEITSIRNDYSDGLEDAKTTETYNQYQQTTEMVEDINKKYTPTALETSTIKKFYKNDIISPSDDNVTDKIVLENSMKIQEIHGNISENVSDKLTVDETTSNTQNDPEKPDQINVDHVSEMIETIHKEMVTDKLIDTIDIDNKSEIPTENQSITKENNLNVTTNSEDNEKGFIKLGETTSQTVTTTKDSVTESFVSHEDKGTLQELLQTVGVQKISVATPIEEQQSTTIQTFTDKIPAETSQTTSIKPLLTEEIIKPAPVTDDTTFGYQNEATPAAITTTILNITSHKLPSLKIDDEIINKTTTAATTTATSPVTTETITSPKPPPPRTTSTTTTTITSTTISPPPIKTTISTSLPLLIKKQPSFLYYKKRPDSSTIKNDEITKDDTDVSIKTPNKTHGVHLDIMKIKEVMEATNKRKPAPIIPPINLEIPSKLSYGGLDRSNIGLSDDLLAFTDLCNEIGFSFWRAMTTSDSSREELTSSSRSLILSPFALTSMLSMIFLGARGGTSNEMNEILRLDDMVTFNPHLIFRNITESIENTKYNRNGGSGNSGFSRDIAIDDTNNNNDEVIANTAFIRELFSDRGKGKILSFFKDKAQQFYSGHVEEVNYTMINDIIRRRTNLLMKRHTLGKINDHLKTNNIWVNPPLAGIMANLFETNCSNGIVNERDGEMFFQVLPIIRQRRLVPIPAVLFKNGFTAGYDIELDATLIAFGKSNDMTSVIFIMPGQQNSVMSSSTSNGLDNLERLEMKLMNAETITRNTWKRLLNSLIERPGLELQIPRFSHKSYVNATIALQKMGLKELFNLEKADLRGLTGSTTRDIYLSDMLQINTFSTCGEEKINDQQHHMEIYPAPTIQQQQRSITTNSIDADDILNDGFIYENHRNRPHHTTYTLEETLKMAQDYQRSFDYDPIYDTKYLELPLPLRPRQARIPDAPRLKFDRPFLYFVRHNPSGMILYMGRFNPRLLP